MDKNTKKIAGTGILTAIVFVLQAVGGSIKLGPFSISLVLIPIVVGAALYGILSGAWLGAAFAAAVLVSGDAGVFLAINPAGTVVTVMLKGILAGLFAGVAYALVEKKSNPGAIITAAIICPVVNTGVFLAGCGIFFMDTIREWAAGTNVLAYMLTGLVGLNFLFELGANLVLAPVIVKLVQLGGKESKK